MRGRLHSMKKKKKSYMFWKKKKLYEFVLVSVSWSNFSINIVTQYALAVMKSVRKSILLFVLSF